MMDIIDESKQPEDRYLVAWWCTMFIGLYPWNAFITAAAGELSYFNVNFPPQYQFIFIMPIAYNISNLGTLFLLNFLGHKFTSRTKLLVGFFLGFAMLVLVPIINYFPLPLMLRYVVCMSATFICGFTTAVLMGTGFGLIAPLPPTYTTALMTGQGVGGVMVGGFQLLMDSVIFANPSPVDVQWKGILMFSVAGIVMLVCTYCAMKLQSMPFYLHFQNLQSQSGSIQMDQRPDEDGNYRGESAYLLDGSSAKLGLFDLFKTVWPDAISVFLVFFISLTIFPGFSNFKNYSGKSFPLPTILILTFQIFDFVGRSAPKFFVIIPKKLLLIVSLLRFVFWPAWYFLCYYRFLPASVGANFLGIGAMVAMSLTNGYFGTLAMMFAPSRVNKINQQAVGTMMPVFLQVGILGGLSLALLLTNVLPQVDPFA